MPARVIIALVSINIDVVATVLVDVVTLTATSPKSIILPDPTPIILII